MNASIADEAADIPPPGQKPDFNVSNPIYTFILVSVVLCSILTTLFTAARLTTKHVVSRLHLEDCGCRLDQFITSMLLNDMQPRSTHSSMGKDLPCLNGIRFRQINLSDAA